MIECLQPILCGHFILFHCFRNDHPPAPPALLLPPPRPVSCTQRGHDRNFCHEGWGPRDARGLSRDGGALRGKGQHGTVCVRASTMRYSIEVYSYRRSYSTTGQRAAQKRNKCLGMNGQDKRHISLTGGIWEILGPKQRWDRRISWSKYSPIRVNCNRAPALYFCTSIVRVCMHVVTGLSSVCFRDAEQETWRSSKAFLYNSVSPKHSGHYFGRFSFAGRPCTPP